MYYYNKKHQDKANKADTDAAAGEENDIMRAISHRCDLPLVLTEEEGVAPLPVGLPFELKRGFFWVFASPPSLITIFA